MYTHIRLRIIPTCVRLPTAASIGANHFFLSLSLSLSLVQPFVCAYGDKRASRFRKRGLYDRCCVYNSLHMVLRSYFCCSEKARILTFKRRNQFHHFLHYSRSDLASYPSILSSQVLSEENSRAKKRQASRAKVKRTSDEIKGRARGLRKGRKAAAVAASPSESESSASSGERGNTRRARKRGRRRRRITLTRG